MKIIFVVNTLKITGGIKVVFIHANNLCRLGHDVSIVHLLKIENHLKGLLLGGLKSLKYWILKFFKKWRPNWFFLDPRIEVTHHFSLSKIGSFDAIIATANETADWVAKVPRNWEKKFYLVQDYEDWTRRKDLVDDTYRLPLKKIVISAWLQKLMREKFHQETAGLVLNGVDFQKFNLSKKRFNQNKIILMQYHILERKGIEIGLEALEAIKRKFPQVQTHIFGAYKPRHKFPEGTQYYYKPTQDQLVNLYQKADIFFSSSLQEGFSLTPMEAMAAKCAVVTTNVGAVSDYSIPGKTAIIIPPGDRLALVKALEDLITDEVKLQSLAINGNQYVRNFTWEKSSQELERIIKVQHLHGNAV